MPIQSVKPGAQFAAYALAIALALPLLVSVSGAVTTVWHPHAWTNLLADSQWRAALGMSLWSGVAATTLAIAASASLLGALFGSPAWERAQRWLSLLLAVPHAAFAIGVVALVAPSGWLLRLLSPWATGLSAPPAWPTTQDPWGLGLVMVLALKEIPFLIWCACAWLQRPDVRQRLALELQLAQTMGYDPQTAWWRVAWPQCVPNLIAPALAVWAYSLSVVDMALVIGPTSPPPLGVLAWQWLREPDYAKNVQGLAAAWVLVFALAIGAAVIVALAQPRLWRKRWSAGVPKARLRSVALPKGIAARGLPALRIPGMAALGAVYGAVLLALALGTTIGSWRFPALLPQTLTWDAWEAVAGQLHTLGTTIGLALAASAIALIWSVAWLELAPRRLRQLGQWLLALPLVLPALVWVAGLQQSALYQSTLRWDRDSAYACVLIAHCLACVPYVYLALVGPYSGFSSRYGQLAATLGHQRRAFLWRVKWPLLRAALASSFAVGFAVSVAQYLPTLYLGAGRLSTVTTEAVAQSSGGQRSLAAAFAALQWLLPAGVFALAAVLGRARKFPLRARPCAR
jgi:putative thiamine transport system permease protein